MLLTLIMLWTGHLSTLITLNGERPNLANKKLLLVIMPVVKVFRLLCLRVTLILVKPVTLTREC